LGKNHGKDTKEKKEGIVIERKNLWEIGYLSNEERRTRTIGIVWWVGWGGVSTVQLG